MNLTRSLLLLVYALTFIQCQLVVIRKKTGDEVLGGVQNCTSHQTFFKTHGTTCITQSSQVGCYLDTIKGTGYIPTIQQQNPSFPSFSLPAHSCWYGTPVLRVVYWNVRREQVVWSHEMSTKILNQMTARLGPFHDKIILNFKKHFSGMLLKIKIGCGDDFTRSAHFYKGDCILIKFDGEVEYPVTSQYFRTLARTTAETTSKVASTTAAIKTTPFTKTTWKTLTTSTEKKTLYASITSPEIGTTLKTGSNETINNNSSVSFIGKSERFRSTNNSTAKVRTNNTFLARNNSSQHDKNKRVKWFIGFVIGCILALITLIFLVFTICWKRKSLKDASQEKGRLMPERTAFAKKKLSKPKPFQEAFNSLYDQLHPLDLVSPGDDEVFKKESNEAIYATVNKQRGSA